MLCVALLLAGNSSAMASEAVEPATEAVEATETMKGEPVDEAVTESEAESESESESETEDAKTEQPETETVDYTFENDEVVITVSAKTDVLPAEAELSVKPITADDELAEVESRLASDAQKNNYEIAGFLAYDICFLADGEEVEPDGTVQVVMNYKEAAIPESVTNAEKTSVSVMHLEETECSVRVEEVTGTIEMNETNAVENASFVTESFSTFTITWKYSSYSSLKINVHYWDGTNGTEIVGNQTRTVSIVDGEEKEFSSFANEIDGYKYVKAAIQKDGSKEVTRVQASSSGYWPKVYTLTLYNGDVEAGSTNSNSPDSMDVYLIYEKSALAISDSVETDGTISVKNPPEGAAEYVWYKSVNGGEYTEVVRQKYKSGDYSVSEDGTSLNIVLSGGALNDSQTSVKYKVAAFDPDGKELASSEEYNVTYYNKVQNGSFESPVNEECNVQADQYDDMTMHQFLYENHPEVIWKATAKGVHNYSKGEVELEIVSTKTEKDRKNVHDWYSWYCGEYDYQDPTYNSYSAVQAADGVQFAEINCEAEAALYQDVLTVKGQELNYWLSHRARGTSPYSNPEYDTMYVVIMPTSVAKTAGDNGGEVDTQAELSRILEGHKTDSGIEKGIYLTGDYEGTYIRKIRSDDQSWHYYEGTYESASYMTRFFFVAGEVSEIASGNAKVGNFVDNIGFSQELPPASDGTFSLQIQKTIEGISNEEDLEKAKESLTFTITATVNDEEDTAAPLAGEKIKGDESGWKWTTNNDGSVTGTYSWKDQKIAEDKTYVYTVEESGAAVDGYNLTTVRDVTSSSRIDDSHAAIKGKNSAIFTFTNTYEKKPASENVSASTRELDKSAHVKSWEDRTYDITLDATVYDTVATSETKAINVALVFDASGSMLFPSDLVEVENVSSLNQLDKNTDYFYVSTDKSATVYRVYYQNGMWRYTDASYAKSNSASEYKYTAGQTIYYSTTGKTRLEYLKDSTCELIQALPEGSVVSLVTFNSQASVYNFNTNKSESYSDSSASTSYSIALNESNRSQLINAINDITTDGGTRQDYALECAKKVMDQTFSNDQDSYVIFLTDGCLNCGGGTYTDGAWNNAINAAKTIQNSGAIIYSVGIDLDLNDQMASAKDLMKQAATSEDTYENIKSNDLGDTFRDLTKEMTNSKDVSVTYAVRDYIDDRFEIADEDQIKALGGTIGQDDNGVYVLWENISQTEKWEKTFTVIAKADYEGGNAVTTNKEGSGIFVAGEDPRYFENPVVNVKPNLTVKDAETTIFLGEKVPFDSEEVGNMTDWTDGTWYADEACTEELAIAGKAIYPEDTVTYYQKVTVKFDSPTDESNENTDNHTAGDAEDYELSEVGKYMVNVVSGELDITKRSQSTKEALGGAEYELRMKNQTGGIPYTTSAFASSLDDETKGQIAFTNLPVGEYELVETIAPEGYAVSNNVYKVVVSSAGIEVSLNESGVASDLLQADEALRNVKASFDIFDVMVYSLPEAGGAGIFAYMFGGMFLMMAGACCIFASRRKAYRQ